MDDRARSGTEAELFCTVHAASVEVPGKIVDTRHEGTCGVCGLFVGVPKPACPMWKLDTLNKLFHLNRLWVSSK